MGTDPIVAPFTKTDGRHREGAYGQHEGSSYPYFNYNTQLLCSLVLKSP